MVPLGKGHLTPPKGVLIHELSCSRGFQRGFQVQGQAGLHSEILTQAEDMAQQLEPLPGKRED